MGLHNPFLQASNLLSYSQHEDCEAGNNQVLSSDLDNDLYLGQLIRQQQNSNNFTLGFEAHQVDGATANNYLVYELGRRYKYFQFGCCHSGFRLPGTQSSNFGSVTELAGLKIRRLLLQFCCYLTYSSWYKYFQFCGHHFGFPNSGYHWKHLHHHH
jgi:hypothetical protein